MGSPEWRSVTTGWSCAFVTRRTERVLVVTERSPCVLSENKVPIRGIPTFN